MTPVQPQDRFHLIGLPAAEHRAAFARDVAAGLTASPKCLPCLYLYDRLGSALFEAICELPEYYLTRAEEAILRTHSDEIAGLFPARTDLIELGSGSARKTRLLIEAFLRRNPVQRYIPLDIAQPVLEQVSLDLVRTYSGLSVLAIAGEYHDALQHLRQTAGPRKLILWLGSNIGNLERREAGRFLGEIRGTMAAGDGMLVGIDLRKDRSVLEPAYDDPCGVTASFNKNLLARINHAFKGHFDLRAFRHRAVYNEEAGRVEMYLVSERAQRVAIDQLKLEIPFGAGEAIHTENSYKYSSGEIDELATMAGLRRERRWLDVDLRFSVNLFVCP
jgi:L-histidine Nalpha-methyltransferase